MATMDSPAPDVATADQPAAPVKAADTAATLNGAKTTPLDKTVAAVTPQAMMKQMVVKQDALADQRKADKAAFDKTHPEPTAPHVDPWTKKLPEANPVQAFGSWASVLGILAGALTRQPLTTALNASASAMKAIRTGDIKAYEDAKQSWEENSKIAVQNAQWEMQAYDRAYDKMKQNWAEGQADLKTAAMLAQNMYQMQHGDAQLGIQQHEAALRTLQVGQEIMERKSEWMANLMQGQDLYEKQRAANPSMPAWKDLPQAQQDAWGARGADARKLEMFKAEHTPTSLKPVVVNGETKYLSDDQIQAVQAAGAKVEPAARSGMSETARTLADVSADIKAEHPDWTPGRIDLEAKSRIADTSSRGVQAMVLREARRNPANDKKSDSQILAESATTIKAYKDFGTGLQGNTVSSFGTALSHLDVAKDLAEALKNGDTRAVNAAKNRWEQAFGGSAPTNLAAASRIVADEVVRAVTRSSGALADRQDAASIINAANSLGQNLGGIEVLQRLMVGQLESLERQYERTTGLQNFRDPETNMLSPEAASLLNRMSPKSAPKSASTPAAAAVPAGVSVSGW